MKEKLTHSTSREATKSALFTVYQPDPERWIDFERRKIEEIRSRLGKQDLKVEEVGKVLRADVI
ncbi:MAG: hypothetical protein ABIB41_05575 [Nitrospirota bacterium]